MHFFLNKIAYFFLLISIRVILRKKGYQGRKNQYFVRYFTFLPRRKIANVNICLHFTVSVLMSTVMMWYFKYYWSLFLHR